MAENQSKCTGNCMACTILQRQYCASQLAYSNMKMLEQLQQTVAGVLVNMKSLSDKIDAIQNNEATLFDPTERSAIPSPEPPITQSGDGVK